MDDVGRSRDAGDEVAEVGRAAHHLQSLLQVQFVGDGDLVDGLPPFEESKAGFVAVGVPVPVEVGGGQTASDLQNRLAVDEQGADDGLFGIYVVGLKSLFKHRTYNLLKKERQVSSLPPCGPCSLAPRSGRVWKQGRGLHPDPRLLRQRRRAVPRPPARRRPRSLPDPRPGRPR